MSGAALTGVAMGGSVRVKVLVAWINRLGVKDQGPDRTASNQTEDRGIEMDGKTVLMAPDTVVT